MPEAPPPAISRAAAQRHWQHTRRLTAALLAVWFAVSFGVAFFARDLAFNFFGWPFSWWVAAQGAGVVFIAILAAYAVRMRRLDDALHGQDPGGRAPPPAPSP